MSFTKCSLPSTLTGEALARELYPHGFWDGDFRTIYGNLIWLLRDLHSFGPRPAWQSDEAYQRQKQALELAVAFAYQRACDTFYTWTCWPDSHLRKAGAEGHVWYFLTSDIDLDSTSKQHEVREVFQQGRIGPKWPTCTGFDAHDTKAIRVASDDEPVHAGVNAKRQLSETYGKWIDEYSGPASGLMDWARSHGLLVYRLDLLSSGDHPWKVH